MASGLFMKFFSFHQLKFLLIIKIQVFYACFQLKLVVFNLYMQPLTPDTLLQEGFLSSPKELESEVVKKYQFLNKLGEGSFGIVMSAIDIKTGRKVAIKKIKLEKHDDGLPSDAMREFSILKQLQHENIVKLHQVIYEWNLPQLCLVLDYHPRSLHEFINSQAPFSTRKIQILSYQIITAIGYIHRRGIMHRDLKPQNFLISSQGQIKLCDFGQARSTSYRFQQFTREISTLWYRAPEVLMGSQVYDEKVDVWAVGCIIAELFLGKPLFQASSQLSLLFLIFQLFGTPKVADYPQITSLRDFSPSYPKFVGEGLKINGISEEALDLLKKLLVINPAKRISMAQAINHQFFASLGDWKKKL